MCEKAVERALGAISGCGGPSGTADLASSSQEELSMTRAGAK